MNVLTISMSDLYGGAAIASHRLHDRLRRMGHTSRMLVGYKGTDDPDVARVPFPGPFNRSVEKISTAVGLPFTTIASTRRIAAHPWRREADVVCLHNLHGRYFNYLALPRLLRGKPAVATLHDMWLFTNGDPYDPRFMEKPEGGGGAGLEWRLKRRVFSKTQMVVVAPSRWLARLAERSILGRFPVHRVPYGLDLEAFRPHNRAETRRRLDIPRDRVALLAMAETLTDPRKGLDLLQAALNKLPEGAAQRCVLLLVGHHGANISSRVRVKTIDLGYLESDEDKARAFSAADVLVCPTRADNLPLVILEALACGAPAVAFNVGGVADMVRPGETGWLARAEDVGDLAAKIAEAIAAGGQRDGMRSRCRAVCEAEYDADLQAQRYTELFEEAIAQRALNG